jgi:hypothetical protein
METTAERKWTMNNVDLDQFTLKIGDFFGERDFEVVRDKIPTGYQILSGNSSRFKLIGYVSVTVEGKPDDFTVKLELVETKRRYSQYGGFLLSLFGGGILVRREALSDEAWIKLRKEFWPYVEGLISELTGTAKSSDNSLKV